MKILFYYRGAENFGIEYISSVLKAAGHKTELIFDPGFDDTFYFKSNILNFLNVRKKILNEAKRFSPDLIAFSSITNLYPYIKETARLLKKELRVPVIIGGIHATALPDYVLKEDCFDILCTGEGEYAMLELADKMEKGGDFSGVENLWVKRNGKIIRNKERPLISDLDSLPFPDKDIFYNKGVFWKSVQVATSRGCPYHCAFCVNSFYLNRYGKKNIRRRGVDNIIEEMKIYKNKYKLQFVHFEDDVFTTSVSWLEEFSDKYRKEIGIKFLINIHPNMVNRDTARLLKEAGCWGACMGVQSADESFRMGLLKRNDTDKQIIEAARLLKKEGIYLTTEFIFGLPQETAEQAWGSVALNDAIKPNSTSTFVFYPFPGTELAEFSYRNGFLDKGAIDMINEGTGSYHTALFLKNENNNLFLNLSYLLPLFLKAPWLVKKAYIKKLCARKTTLFHKIIGICVIPFHNPILFKEKMLNYIRMFRVYICR
jgi:radical SAM superfamily enzyme YgiQ (UPF0313 family)